MSGVDVREVMAPGEDKVIHTSGWRWVKNMADIPKVEASFPLLNTPTHYTYRSIPHYEATIRFAGEPRRSYLVDAEELDEARTAVAELIEAADEVQAASAEIEDAEGEYCPLKVPMDVQSNLNRALFAAQDRFEAALRRAKGESE